LTLTGRLKRIAKVYGHRFNLDELESFAAAAAGAAVAAVARDDLVVVFAEIGAGDASARLRTAVAEHLRVHPDAVDARSVERIPTNANGKPDYALIESWT
jgi:hypothetical protein